MVWSGKCFLDIFLGGGGVAKLFIYFFNVFAVSFVFLNGLVSCTTFDFVPPVQVSFISLMVFGFCKAVHILSRSSEVFEDVAAFWHGFLCYTVFT